MSMRPVVSREGALAAGTESRAEQVGACDLVVFQRAEKVLLDDVRLTLFDALEPVGEMQTIADLVEF